MAASMSSIDTKVILHEISCQFFEMVPIRRIKWRVSSQIMFLFRQYSYIYQNVEFSVMSVQTSSKSKRTCKQTDKNSQVYDSNK